MDIDLDADEWRFTVSKTKTPHLVPLSTKAVAILRELKPLTSDSVFVFPSTRSKTRPMSDNAVLAAMRRLGIDKEEMSGHGFRAMARTILDEVLGSGRISLSTSWRTRFAIRSGERTVERRTVQRDGG